MRLRIFLAVLSLTLGASANATLIGDSVNIDWNFPSQGTVVFSTSTTVAADASDVVNIFDASTQLDMNASGFVLSSTFPSITGGVAFNGLHVWDMQWVDQPGEIVGLDISAVGIDPTGIVGTIGANGDEVFLNLVGVAGNYPQGYEITVNFDTRHVPTSGTLALIGAGLLATGLLRRRKYSA